MKKNGLMPPVSLSQYGLNNIEMYRDNLKSHTKSIVEEDQKTQMSSFDVMKTFDLDPSYETCMLAGEDHDSMIFNKFIDAILWHGIAPTPDTLRTDRFNIATEITKSAKNIWESTNQKWQNSSAQMFMNELRQNIKSFTPLDINKQENVILKSIAAFVLKGEDFDAVVQFCEDNSYSNYSYALALWGATIGYVKMSKPIIASLTKYKSFSNTYKDIISLLYNIESKGELPYVEEPIRVEPQPVSVYDGDNDSLRIWQNGIRSYLDQLKNVPKKKNLYPPLESAFKENGDQMDYAKFFAILNDYKEWKTTKGEPIKAWKSMVEHFCPDEYSNRFGSVLQSSREKVHQPKNMKEKVLDFFGLTSGEDNSQEEILIEENMPKNVSSSYPSTGSFLTDIDFLSTNENSVRLLSACHSDWNKDLSWFIDAHKSNSTFEHYKNKPQDNETVIRQFVNLKKGRYKRMEDFLRRIYKL